MSIQKKYINKIDAINYPILPKEYRKYPTMNLDDAYEKGWSDLQEILSNQAEENVVEVVRCCDCIYHTGDDDCTNGHWNNWSNSDYDENYPEALETDYCSHGVRRNG